MYNKHDKGEMKDSGTFRLCSEFGNYLSLIDTSQLKPSRCLGGDHLRLDDC